MAASPRSARRRTPRRRSRARRYTIDASVFVNAFNPHEEGHAASLALLASIQELSDPIVVPTLFVPEVAAAVTRSTGDATGAPATESADERDILRLHNAEALSAAHHGLLVQADRE